jgi:hypothetical protein
LAKDFIDFSNENSTNMWVLGYLNEF